MSDDWKEGASETSPSEFPARLNEDMPAGESVADDSYSINIQINERQFHNTNPQYATVPHVTFDGVNYHLVFLVTAPSPLPVEHEQRMKTVPAQVVARIVIPPPVVLSTIQALQNAIGQVAEDSVFIGPSVQEEQVDGDGPEL